MTEESKKQAKNYMVFVSVVALAIGAIGGMIQQDNPFQALALVITALVMIGFFAVRLVSKKEEDKESLVEYYKKLQKQRKN